MNIVSQWRSAVLAYRKSKRNRVIRQYIDVASKHSGSVMVDEKQLPYPKSVIQGALIDRVRESSTGRDVLCSIYCGTAIYQARVASRDAVELLDCIQRELAQLELQVKEFRGS
jgi:hypothetical protein